METLSIIIWTMKDIIGLSILGLILVVVLIFILYYQALKFKEWIVRKFKKPNK